MFQSPRSSGPAEGSHSEVGTLVAKRAATKVKGARHCFLHLGQQPVTYGYDDASRLTQVAQSGLAVGLHYDAAGRRNSLTYSNGTSTSYGYDAASRLLSIGHSGPSGVIENLYYT